MYLTGFYLRCDCICNPLKDHKVLWACAPIQAASFQLCLLLFFSQDDNIVFFFGSSFTLYIDTMKLKELISLVFVLEFQAVSVWLKLCTERYQISGIQVWISVNACQKRPIKRTDDSFLNPHFKSFRSLQWGKLLLAKCFILHGIFMMWLPQRFAIKPIIVIKLLPKWH